MATNSFIVIDKDYNHVNDQEYVVYRQNANDARSKYHQLSQKSQYAYKRGDKAEAKRLSNEAKQILNEADKWNAMAAEFVFLQNNMDSDENDIDLHGLYVKEAEYILKQRIINGVQRKQSSLDCIVGKGKHSAGGIAKLKPAIEMLCEEAGIRCEVDHKNTGVLIIYLSGFSVPSSWSNINPNGMGAMLDNQNVPDRRTGRIHGQPIQQQQQQQQQSYYHQQQQQQQQQQSNLPIQQILSLVVRLIRSCF